MMLSRNGIKKFTYDRKKSFKEEGKITKKSENINI